MSIFHRTSGQGGENIATEILVYLLIQEQRFEAFKSKFFMNLFGTQSNTLSFIADMYTQIQFNNGRPDIIALVNDTLIVFELKLGSSLSGMDQLIKYTKIFNETIRLRTVFPSLPTISIKHTMLVYIAPEKYIQSSISITDSQIPGKSFTNYCGKKGITFKCMSWEKINDLLDTNNELENELRLYINSYLQLDFSKEEILVFKNLEIPEALQKSYNKINIIRSNISLENFGNIRFSQSFNYSGFYFSNNELEFYFGYLLHNWVEFKTPFSLQARKSRIDVKDKDMIVQKLLNLEFQYTKDKSKDELVIPFFIENESEWQFKLEEIIKKYNE